MSVSAHPYREAMALIAEFCADAGCDARPFKREFMSTYSQIAANSIDDANQYARAAVFDLSIEYTRLRAAQGGHDA